MIMDIEKLKSICEESSQPIGNMDEFPLVKALHKSSIFRSNVGPQHVLELIKEIQTLRDKVASAEGFNLEQILHDPENQPSQYGTVPLEWYENLENKINRIRFNVEQVIDSLSGSYDMHTIREKLQTAVDDEAYAIWKDKLSEVKQND